MAVKDHRRELRLSSSDDELITEAAGLFDVSVSEFLLDRAVADADAIVDAHRNGETADETCDRFLAALDAPAKPLPLLVDQIRKSRTTQPVGERFDTAREKGKIMLRDEPLGSHQPADPVRVEESKSVRGQWTCNYGCRSP